MPEAQDHIAKVAHNERLTAYLGAAQQEYPDWIITARFYTALHLVDIVLAKSGIHPVRHHGKLNSRDSHVERDVRLSGVFKPYRHLEDLSQTARYTNDPVSSQHLLDSASALKDVRDHIQALVPDMPLPPPSVPAAAS